MASVHVYAQSQLGPFLSLSCDSLCLSVVPMCMLAASDVLVLRPADTAGGLMGPDLGLTERHMCRRR
jgi:hypothetical protein